MTTLDGLFAKFGGNDSVAELFIVIPILSSTHLKKVDKKILGGVDF
jgi:hypothetical protein